MDTVKIGVEWADDDPSVGPLPDAVQEVPRQVYDEGMTAGMYPDTDNPVLSKWAWSDDPVSEYLSDTFGYLVQDWWLTSESGGIYSPPFSRISYNGDYPDGEEPTCDICGRAQDDSPNILPKMREFEVDWNGETGNHEFCEEALRLAEAKTWL